MTNNSHTLFEVNEYHRRHIIYKYDAAVGLIAPLLQLYLFYIYFLQVDGCGGKNVCAM